MSTKTEIWTADCETDPFKAGRMPEPFIWGAYCLALDIYEEFATFSELLEFLDARGKVIVYAHNGGKFDWHFGLDHIPAFEPIMIIAGRIARFKIGGVEFRDSYNILPVPLREMQKDDFDYSKLERDVRHMHMDEIRRYLRNDCVYLAEYVGAFIERYGLNLTIASSAMKFWREKFGIKAPGTSQGFYELFSNFYFGGRVQCFERGEINRPFRVVDINSAYPFAMMHLHPWGDVYNWEDELPENRQEAERCFIELECEARGAFPIRKENGGLDFPDDGEVRRFFVTGWEYFAALETVGIGSPRILSIARFHQSIEFKGYINHFYSMKASAEKGSSDYVFSKLFMNSLYGKFAANPDKYSEHMFVGLADVLNAEKDGYEFDGIVLDKALMSKPIADAKKRFYNVATAASITGFVRAYLWRAICSTEKPIYCDTDSIAFSGSHGLDLDPKRLGAWDVEAECDRGAVAGKKLYAFHMEKPDKNGNQWKTASKGVRLTPEEIERVACGEVVEYTPEAPTFSIKTGKRFNSRKVQLVD